MGGFGSILGALLQGASQGFVEAEQEDKLKKQKEKLAIQQRRFDVAKLIFADPSTTPEAKQASIAIIGGATGKVAADFDRIVAFGSMTEEIPGRTASALPQGQAVSPLNQEGQIQRDEQASIVQDDVPQREAPLALEAAPRSVAVEQAPPETGPTPEALSRQVIIEPTTREIPLFRSKEDIAEEEGRLDVIRGAAVLDDKAKRKFIADERDAIRADKALTKSIESVLGEGQDSDLVANLIRSGMTGNEAFQQGGLDKKPTRVQRRTFTKAAMTEAFFGLATIAEAKADIPDWEILSDLEIKGLRDRALIERKNKERIADGRSEVSFREAGKAWNSAMGKAQDKRVRDPNEVLVTFIPLRGIALEEQIDINLRKDGYNPDQIRQLVNRPFEDIVDRSGEVTREAQEAVDAGKAELLPEFRPVPSHAAVDTPVRRRGKNPVDIALELFKKDLGE